MKMKVNKKKILLCCCISLLILVLLAAVYYFQFSAVGYRITVPYRSSFEKVTDLMFQVMSKRLLNLPRMHWRGTELFSEECSVQIQLSLFSVMMISSFQNSAEIMILISRSFLQ